jgi:hypothetical protein
MAPFSGTDEERRTLAGFLFKMAGGEIKMGPSSRPFYSPEGSAK